VVVGYWSMCEVNHVKYIFGKSVRELGRGASIKAGDHVVVTVYRGE
jgi:ribosomal protein L7Ae-like RNA K-turn-binding protein